MIQDSMIYEAQKYKTLTNKNPTIIIGKQTFNNEFNDIKISNAFGYLIFCLGYNCKLGNFDFGYKIN